jgi:hypothetical protein
MSTPLWVHVWANEKDHPVRRVLQLMTAIAFLVKDSDETVVYEAINEVIRLGRRLGALDVYSHQGCESMFDSYEYLEKDIKNKIADYLPVGYELVTQENGDIEIRPIA